MFRCICINEMKSREFPILVLMTRNPKQLHAYVQLAVALLILHVKFKPSDNTPMHWKVSSPMSTALKFPTAHTFGGVHDHWSTSGISLIQQLAHPFVRCQ
jgi:hypothetical protein